MDDQARLYIWRKWLVDVFPKMPRHFVRQHHRSKCDRDVCQWFSIIYRNKNYTLCKLSGEVHVCPGSRCPFIVVDPIHETEICKATGLVVEQKLDALSSVYAECTSLQPDPDGLLGTFIGDISDTGGTSLINTQRIVNAQSRRHGASLDKNDRVDVKIAALRTLREVQAEVTSSLAATIAPSPLLEYFQPHAVSQQTMLAAASLRKILNEGYETRKKRSFNMPNATSIRHAVVDRFQQQFQIPSLRNCFDVLRAVDAAVRVVLDCNRRPPLHVAVIRSNVEIPPVDEKIVMRVARYCANLFPCVYALGNADEPRHAQPNFAVHCMALTRQLVDGIVFQGVQLLPSIPLLALWLPATDAIVATMRNTTQKDLTQTIGTLNGRLVTLYDKYKIDPLFWANEQCRAWPAGVPLPVLSK